MIGMKEQCFGVEIEMTGITRQEAARALSDHFGTEPAHWGHAYDSWNVSDLSGKIWKLMSDSSIRPERRTADGYLRFDKDSEEGKRYKVELVTPKLTYDDLPRLQECMRRVKAIGAKVNDSCGLHVHVDASNHNRQSLKNLIGIMYSKESRGRLSYLTPDRTKPVTARKLGDDFDRAAILETLTQNAQDAARAAEKPTPRQEYPRSIRSRLERAKATVNAPKQDGVQRMVDIAAKKAEGKGKGYEKWATLGVRYSPEPGR